MMFILLKFGTNSLKRGVVLHLSPKARISVMDYHSAPPYHSYRHAATRTRARRGRPGRLGYCDRLGSATRLRDDLLLRSRKRVGDVASARRLRRRFDGVAWSALSDESVVVVREVICGFTAKKRVFWTAIKTVGTALHRRDDKPTRWVYERGEVSRWEP
jgi:hypothetical protein